MVIMDAAKWFSLGYWFVLILASSLSASLIAEDRVVPKNSFEKVALGDESGLAELRRKRSEEIEQLLKIANSSNHSLKARTLAITALGDLCAGEAVDRIIQIMRFPKVEESEYSYSIGGKESERVFLEACRKALIKLGAQATQAVFREFLLPEIVQGDSIEGRDTNENETVQISVFRRGLCDVVKTIEGREIAQAKAKAFLAEHLKAGKSLSEKGEKFWESVNKYLGE